MLKEIDCKAAKKIRSIFDELAEYYLSVGDKEAKITAWNHLDEIIKEITRDVEFEDDDDLPEEQG